MKLLIISNMAHYKKNNRLVGWGPAVREIDQIASLFDQVVHIGCLHEEPPPDSAIPYSASNIRFVGVPPAGGKGFRAKWGVLRLTPLYLRTMLRELRRTDLVHVRGPANIPLLAIVLLAFLRWPKYRWAKYGGNWRPEKKTPWTYRFQRWWLKNNFHRGLVTVNDFSARHPRHVFSLFNPSFHSEEVERFRQEVEKKGLGLPVRLLFVGALTENKGIRTALEVIQQLWMKDVECFMDIVGDGPLKRELQKCVTERPWNGRVRWYGWVPHTEIASYYLRAHFLVFPTRSEGWPKVVGEALGYGVVPLVSAVSFIPETLESIGCGRTFSPNDVEGYVNAIWFYLQHPEIWMKERDAAIESAFRFSYEAFLSNIREIFFRKWGILLSVTQQINSDVIRKY